MGRYYQTDKPEFVQDIIMKPDYNILANSLLEKQKAYNEQKDLAEKFMDIEFNHLNSDEENENAATAKDYYLQNANRIASLMAADKNNFRKYMGELKDLQRQLKMDFSEGAIGKMQASYNQEKSWKEANKETLKTNPALYNALYREAQKNWGGNSVTNGIWSQENALKNFDQQKIEENIQKLVADIKKSSVQTTNGRYKTTIEGEVKELTEDDILNYAKNKVLSDPEALAYFRQAQRVGIGNYFNPDGSLNTTSGQLGSWLQGLKSYAYRQESQEQKLDEDKYGLIAAEEAKEKRVAKYKKDLEKTEEEQARLWQVDTEKLLPDGTVEEQANSLRAIMTKDPNLLSPEEKIAQQVVHSQANDEILKWGKLNKTGMDLLNSFGISYDNFTKAKSYIAKGESKLDANEKAVLDKVRDGLSKIKIISQNMDSIRDNKNSMYGINKDRQLFDKKTGRILTTGTNKNFTNGGTQSVKSFIVDPISNINDIYDDVYNKVIRAETLKGLARQTYYEEVKSGSQFEKDVFDRIAAGGASKLMSGISSRNGEGWNIDESKLNAEQETGAIDKDINTLQDLMKVVPENERSKYFGVQVARDGSYKLIVKDNTLGGRMDKVDGLFGWGSEGTRIKNEYKMAFKGSGSTYWKVRDKQTAEMGKQIYNISPELYYKTYKENGHLTDLSVNFAKLKDLVSGEKGVKGFEKEDFYARPDVMVRLKRIKNEKGKNIVVYAPYDPEKENPDNLSSDRFTELKNADDAAVRLQMIFEGLSSEKDYLEKGFKPVNTYTF